MSQARRPAGTPAGGQFAPTHRPEASGIQLTDDATETSGPAVPVGLEVDWERLRAQKARLVELADPRSELGGDVDLAGIVSLLDDIQDQAAEVLGELTIFSKVDDGPDGAQTAPSPADDDNDETAVCDECGEVIEGELAVDQHAVWCSLHPGNVVDSSSVGAVGVATQPSYSSLREAMEAEGDTWTWTAVAAALGREHAEDLFERSGGSLGTALALAWLFAVGADADLPHADDPRIESSGGLAEYRRFLGNVDRPSPSGELPVRLQAHLLRTHNSIPEMSTKVADTLERQHEALRGIQALLSDPQWDSPADRLEWIATLIEGAGYAHETYRPEVGEPIELHLEKRTVVGRIEMIAGDETLVVPGNGGRPVRLPTAAIEWDRDNQTWFHAPEDPAAV